MPGVPLMYVVKHKYAIERLPEYVPNSLAYLQGLIATGQANTPVVAQPSYRSSPSCCTCTMLYANLMTQNHFIKRTRDRSTTRTYEPNKPETSHGPNGVMSP